MYYILWVILTFSSYFLEISIWNFQREELFVVTNTVGWNPYLVDWIPVSYIDFTLKSSKTFFVELLKDPGLSHMLCTLY